MPHRLFTAEHMRAKARKRLPRVVFDFVDGGAGSERGVAHNLESLARLYLLPRVLVECETRSLARTLFGTAYDLPFAVAPIGLCNLVWPGADIALADAALRANIPFILSTAGTCTIEKMAERAGAHGWFQLYVGRSAAVTDDLIARAEAAGAPVLVVTVDVPAPGYRVRDMVNGFSMPLNLSPGGLLDFCRRPAWITATLKAGMPRFANYARYTDAQASKAAFQAFMAEQCSSRLDWALLKDIRARWPRKLVVKGILRAEDARRAVDCGADGIVVSNHGGRQLDSTPAPIDMLPQVRAAVGTTTAVLMDGGLRSGSDIVKALALGADFVLLGRAFLWGIAALGPARGAQAVIDMLRLDLDRTLAQLGCRSLGDLSEDHICRN